MGQVTRSFSGRCVKADELGSLVYADDLKTRLLNYIHSTVAFSEAEVDFKVVSWNR